MRASVSALIIRTVDGRAGAWIETTSERASRSSSSTISTPGTGGSRTAGSVAMTCMPSPCAATATREAIRPIPISPSVLASSSRARPIASARKPWRARATCWGRCFVTASSSANVCSAVDTIGAIGVLHTVMPAAAAAATSTLSYPTPTREITLARGASANATAFHGRAALTSRASATSSRSSVPSPTSWARPSTRSR